MVEQMNKKPEPVQPLSARGKPEEKPSKTLSHVPKKSDGIDVIMKKSLMANLRNPRRKI